jgi:putative endonuclease
MPNDRIGNETVPPATNRKTGILGERLAAHHLEAIGFHLLARNLKVGRLGEIDLVARAEDGRTLCFVEVKARTSELYGTPAESVTSRKQARIRKMAQAWLSRRYPEDGTEGNPGDIPIRFDVVEVMLDRKNHSARVHHIPNAF